MADTLDRLKSALADRYTIEYELGAAAGSIAASVPVTESVTHGKVWHFDFSSPATGDTNSRFDSKLLGFHARLKSALHMLAYRGALRV